MATEGNRDTTITFSGVGSTREEIREANRADWVSPVPIGIKTPLEEGSDDGLFRSHYSVEATVADNLRNLLLTNWGERLGRYKFGANLRSLLFSYGEPGFESSVSTQISAAVGKWMPYVSLGAVEISQGTSTAPGITAMVVKVVYTVPAANPDPRAVEVMIFAGG